VAAPITSQAFKANAKRALADVPLQASMRNFEANFIGRRTAAAARLPEFEALRDAARDIKDHTLTYLDLYLRAFEDKVVKSGGHVHWAATPEDARTIVLDLCQRLGARTVTKGKSMISEEIGLNAYLAENGVTPVETDLGEYIIQLRGEMPSHIIAPAVHLTRAQVEADFRRAHDHLPPERKLDDAATMLAEARGILRERFLAADVGITGANFLIAETGTAVIVTNEGNGDLTQTLPRAHIVLASIEKVVPTLEDATTLLRVLARSATGQEQAVYTTFATGPRRATDPDGPNEFHVVLLDNGRSKLLGTPLQPVLRCIRCGACYNHCPVYQRIGGHAYGWVYGGPVGSVLTPMLIGIGEAKHLPCASTLCGRCEDVCPVRIPLPSLLRHWREQEFDQHIIPKVESHALAIYAYIARRGWLYRPLSRIAVMMMRLLAFGRGRLGWLPLAGGWTAQRDLPAPSGGTFQSAWRKHVKARRRAAK
jgi:L-lactate dehydrogenase complex protein LldF